VVVKDALNNNIQSGSVIVYPGRSGSNLWMNCAIVIEVQQKPGRDGEPRPFLKVLGMSEAQSGKVSYYLANVSELSRVVVVHPIHYNDNVRRLVDYFHTEYKTDEQTLYSRSQ
jgi:hypothetical protein